MQTVFIASPLHVDFGSPQNVGHLWQLCTYLQTQRSLLYDNLNVSVYNHMQEISKCSLCSKTMGFGMIIVKLLASLYIGVELSSLYGVMIKKHYMTRFA